VPSDATVVHASSDCRCTSSPVTVTPAGWVGSAHARSIVVAVEFEAVRPPTGFKLRPSVVVDAVSESTESALEFGTRRMRKV